MLVSFSPTAPPINIPAMTKGPRCCGFADSIRPTPAMTGSAVRISAKLVPTSDNVIGPNAAMTTDAASISPLAAPFNTIRESQQISARLRPWIAPSSIPHKGAPT